MITEAEFRALAAQGYNRIPLVLESFADLDTPLSLYLKLANSATRSCSNRSSAASASAATRSSGCRRSVRMRVRGTHVEVEDDGGVVERHDGDPLAFVREFLRRFRAAPLPRIAALLRRARRLFRLRHGAPHRDAGSPARASPPTPAPRRPSRHAAAADRGARGRRQPVGQDLPDRLRRSRRAGRLRAGAGSAAGTAPQAARAGDDPVSDRERASRDAESEFGADAYQGRGARAPRSTSRPATSCRWCCRSGCACRSPRRRCRCTARCARSIRRRTCSTTTSATSTSSAHRRRSSCARRDRQSRCGPIAGTRPRGATREADEALAPELAADPKEIAEHVMLLDLGRNDVGRVAHDRQRCA